MTDDLMADVRIFAANTLLLLQEDPRRYRLFGSYWRFVKVLLKAHYAADTLMLLGDCMAADGKLMPNHPDLRSALTAAVQEYKTNASFRDGAKDRDGERRASADSVAGRAPS
jgi:hypothetical protein